MDADLRTVENLGEIAVGGSHNHVPESVVRGVKSRHRCHAGEVSQRRHTEECSRLVIENLAQIAVGRYHHNMSEIIIGRVERISGHNVVETGEVGLPFPLLRIEEDLEDLPFGCANDSMAKVVAGAKEPTERRKDWIAKGCCHSFFSF